jgi:hypothetical protein
VTEKMIWRLPIPDVGRPREEYRSELFLYSWKKERKSPGSFVLHRIHSHFGRFGAGSRITQPKRRDSAADKDSLVPQRWFFLSPLPRRHRTINARTARHANVFLALPNCRLAREGAKGMRGLGVIGDLWALRRETTRYADRRRDPSKSRAVRARRRCSPAPHLHRAPCRTR